MGWTVSVEEHCILGDQILKPTASKVKLEYSHHLPQKSSEVTF